MLKAFFYYAVLFGTLLLGCVAIAVFFPRSLAKSERAATVSAPDSASVAAAVASPADVDIDSDTVTVFSTADETVSALPTEEFVAEVVMAELLPSFDDEALKAMAVAARTYIRYHALYGSAEIESHHGAVMCTDSTHCFAAETLEEAAVRLGTDAANSFYLRARAAAEATRGKVLYYDGAVINAVFHAMSYKCTEDAKNVWGGSLPYLVSVPTPETTALDGMVTEKTVTAADCKRLFGGSVEKISTDGAGRLSSLSAGQQRYTGTEVRQMLGLRSTFVTLKQSADGCHFTVYGSGHGVGMSQWGAQCYARSGKDYVWILAHYYPQTSLA